MTCTNCGRSMDRRQFDDVCLNPNGRECAQVGLDCWRARAERLQSEAASWRRVLETMTAERDAAVALLRLAKVLSDRWWKMRDELLTRIDTAKGTP